MAVKLNQHDLEFILTQIKIAEAHTAGTPLDQLVVQPHLPYGLRTVDGSYNNLIAGRELWGASGQPMPRMLEQSFRDDGDDDSIDLNGPAPGELTNGDYDTSGPTADVVDADPRIISNLVTDQTLNNPAAIAAALQYAGSEDLMGDLALVQAAYNTFKVDAALLQQAHLLASGTGVAPGIAAVREVFDAQLAGYGIEMEGNNIVLPNVAPDEGLSAPFNGWMTFFGQFFDHGLDLIAKKDNGTIYVPLEADDPLRTHGPDGIADSGDEVPDHMAFMVLTRSEQVAGPGADGILGTLDDTAHEAINKTTPFVDQNQTYTSHPSHQVFLREYALDDDGKPLATGRLLDGAASHGLPTWAEVKAQAAAMLGITLTDYFIDKVPLLRTDLYGEFIRDPITGFAQVVVNVGPDGIPNTDDDVVASGTPGAPLDLMALNGGSGPALTIHAFLDDIAHNAVPGTVYDADGNPATQGTAVVQADADTDTGNAIGTDYRGRKTAYDDELLDRHFITGDGRGNENIGLTAVHHVFHSEHNRQVAANQLEILKSGDLDFINEWLLDGQKLASLPILPADPLALADYIADLGWDGERLFQTARFATEMQYQHLVFEEFGRKVQPLIDLFIFNTTTDINPAIFAEFAHTVYRFGHSMLTDGMTLMPLDEMGNPIYYDANGDAQPVAMDDWGIDVGLIEAFLNPVMFDKDQTITADQAAGAIVRGMMKVRGSEIDEFVVEALRNNLLGLPLDLPAINIARGRDAGVPTLNDARAQLYAASSSTFLKPYDSWADFAGNLKTPASVINFIAAYGMHDAIVNATTLDAKRAAATLLVMGDGNNADGVTIGSETYLDQFDFLNATGAWANQETGLNYIDLWIGGLAEKKMPFGGFLGSTFNAVFELQMENLQENDRFYYLTRTQGLNLLNELENNAFSKLIMANTDLTHPGADGVRGTEDDIINFSQGIDSFALHDFVFEMDDLKQIGEDPEADNPVLGALFGGKVVRDNPGTADDEAVANTYFRFFGGEHVAVNGTAANDTIITDFGDDAIWGGAGDDRIESGAGVDLVVGGAGDDIMTDSGDTGDFLKGEGGDDVIANSNGLDVLMGGDGKDVLLAGIDGTEMFGGEGDDFMLGGDDHDFFLGNEGSDWMEGGDGFDVTNGDNSELFFNSTILGHDVMFAGANEHDFDSESGDDIMVQGESVMRNEGMFGFDWAIHKGNPIAGDSDMRIPIFTNVADDILRDRFDQTEGLSGWHLNDVLKGDDRGSTEEIEVEFNMTNHELTWAGVDRIAGIEEMLAGLLLPEPATGVDRESVVAFKAGNVIIGGDGNDTIEGRGGDDFIHGDAWLNVRIRITGIGEANEAGYEIATVDTLKHVFADGDVDSDGQAVPVAWHGMALSELLLAGVIKPNQLHIVREILYDEDTTNNVDTAVYAGNRDWYEITPLDGDRVKIARREMEEIDPQISEGTDTLVGIERIQFADQTITIRETGNVDPTGRLVFVTNSNGDPSLPALEGKEMKVSTANIRDENNPGGVVSNINLIWQVERNDGTGDYMTIPGVSGDTFTPDDEHTGLRIRVIGTYVDAGGVTETVSSNPSDVVLGINDPPVGDLLISDMSPTEGQELLATAAFTDPDGMSDAFEEFLLVYQWEYSDTGVGGWTPVPAEEGGNLRNFTPGPAQVGMYLRVVVTYTDDLAFEHVVPSAVTAVVGNHVVSDAATIGGGPLPDGLNDGDNFVQGGASTNNITGLGGNDVLNGGGGDDTINGGAGNDTLAGQLDDDIVNGDAGNDTVVYTMGDGTDTIDGGADFDTLRVLGGSTDDTATVVLDGAGAISAVGGAGIDNVENVNLDLGTGVDRLDFSAAAENLSVNLLTGAATGFSFIRGVENVDGGAGSDTLLGNNAANVLDGGAGADTIRGGFGNDTLRGGTENDSLYGDQGDDTLIGGDGDDRIDGGAENDTASYAGATAAVTVSLALAASQDTFGAGSDMLVSVENLTGSSHGDTLAGNDGANVIDGGAGADAMSGGDGDDTYVVDNAADAVTEDADGGNDTVRTSLASYVLADNVENLVLTGGGDATGNAGDNTLTGDAGDNVLDGGLGNDTVVLDGHITDYDFALNGAGNIEVTSAAGGTDELISIENIKIGGVVHNIAAGTNAANTGLGSVNGTGGPDLVLGFDGVDGMVASGGNDILVGGAGNDDMAGGDGDDTYIVEQAGDQAIENGTGGIDTIYSPVTRNLNNVNHADGDIENVVLIGSANVNATGNALGNELTGNSGNNILSGQNGADTLVGNAGDDDLRGGAGNDRLSGGDGDDVLNGQGGGEDVAVFAGAAGDYTFNVSGGGLASVTHLGVTGGTDTLTNIERLEFGDGASMAIVTDAPGVDGNILATEASIILGGDGNDEIRGSVENDVIVGGAGDDALFGSDLPEGDNATTGDLDDDTFIWNVGDGSDTVHGGFEGLGGDTLVVNGNDESEIYRIYTVEEATARIGFAEEDAGGDFEPEIVVTRQAAGGEETVIAVLVEIEEIVVNGSNVGGNGSAGGDTFEIYGDFETTTSLRPNTITIIGSSGDDEVNISSLLSAHRIVFKSKGGNDVIIGTLRPHDVIELEDGKTIDDYVQTQNPDGTTTIASDTHSVTFSSSGGTPQFGSGNNDDDEDDDENEDDDDVVTPPADDDDDQVDDEDDEEDEDDDEEVVTPPPSEDDDEDTVSPVPGVGTPEADVLIGTDLADHLIGFEGDDVLIGHGGNDVLVAGAGNDFLSGWTGDDMILGDMGDDTILGGDGNDMIFGGDGADRIMADAGDDLVDAGAGNDSVVGGAGDDVFTAAAGDGNDVYFGDEMTGGDGTDMLDMRSVSSATTVDLGSGLQGLGSATSALSGHDTLWGIENVATGAGADHITASNAVNVIDGGTGNDTFHFKSIAAADGDTIVGFEAGDKIDLSMVDANAASFGNQAFTTIMNGPATAVAQLVITHEDMNGDAYTVIRGHVTDTEEPDFTINIEGTHDLNASNFDL